MSYKRIAAVLALVSMIATIAMIPSGYAQSGPKIEVLRHEVISSPDANLIAMQSGRADISPDQIRTSDIEKLDSDGMLLTQDLGFHMGFIGYNIRDLAAIDRVSGGVGWKDLDWYDYRSELIGHYWPFADAAFRHALVHSYDQLGIIPPIYGYIVTPVRSLVPPAQSKYYSPDAEAHPFNQGDPFTSPAGEHSSVGILKQAGYQFVDAGTIGVVDSADYWRDPSADHEPLPYMHVYTPLITIAPTSLQHGQEFAADLGAIGLQGTAANSYRGLNADGYDFNEYLNMAYGTSSSPGGLVDGFMVFYSLGRIPDQLYSMLHSSQDVAVFGQAQLRNSAGVDDPYIDELTEVVHYSLDPDDIEVAAKEIQVLLYDTSNSYSLAYMLLYSRSLFNAFQPYLEGVVKSPGYGSDNTWTYLNARWAPGHERLEDIYGDGEPLEEVLVYANGDEPGSLNINFATTVYEFNILGLTFDGLTAVNPYNHYDVPWIAESWDILETPAGGMNISMTLRSGVEWQDGYPVNATDVKWCLEFLHDWQVPSWWENTQDIIDVVVHSEYELTIRVAAAGLATFYDIIGIGVMLPRQIWDRPWANVAEIVDWDPTIAYDAAPGYDDGSRPTPTNIMGTGMYIFQFYDGVNFYDHMYKNEYYFMSQTELDTMLTNMFWEVGDADKGGLVDTADMSEVSLAFGALEGGPRWNANCNFVPDTPINRIEMRDMAMVAYHLTWQKEWTVP